METTMEMQGALADGTAEQDTMDGMQEERCERAQSLRACADFAETLSSLYFKPLTQEQIDALAQQDLEAFKGLDAQFDQGINDITRYLRKRNTGTRQQLACDFTSAFVGTKTYEGKSAVPYESVFTSEDGLLCQQAYHDVVAEYRREGLEKDDGLDIPDDHLSYLLAFTGALMRRAADALESGDSEGARHDLETVADFVDTHILSWFDSFRERCGLLLQTRFYRGVLAMTRGYLDFEQDFLRRTLAAVPAGCQEPAGAAPLGERCE